MSPTSDSFDELGLAPELVEALSAEGIERPTSFQASAIPVIRRGNNLVGRAGAGGGTLVAYGVALLDRLGGIDRDDLEGPGVVVLTPTAGAADRLAGSLARLARAVDLRVAAVGGAWASPERADVLFATPASLLTWLRQGRVSLADSVSAVVDQASSTATIAGLDALETLFEFLPQECQRVVVDLPLRDEVEEFVERHLRKAVHLPPRPVEAEERPAPREGEIRFRIVEEPKAQGGLRLVSEALEDASIQRVLVYVRDDDRAADVADHLELHGHATGAPGDGEAQVWVGVDAGEGREALRSEDGGVAVLSWDVPAGPEVLDARHGGGRREFVLLLAREVAHLRDVARRAGYRVVPFPPPPDTRVSDDLLATVDSIEAALEEEDVGAYLLLLETLFEQHDPAEVAAATVALLRKKQAGEAAAAEAARAGGAAGAATGAARPGEAPASRAPAFVRLFVSIGTRDGAGPGDIVGAIAGESGVEGSRVGKIDLRESFSIVEVEEAVADRVIRGLNGTTVKGRSVRVDFDRAGQRGEGAGPGGRGGRGGGRGGGGGRDRSRSGGGRGR